MESIWIYLIKSSLVLSCFYGCYWFLLRNGANHRFNRLFLLSALAASMVLPLITVSVRGDAPNVLSTIAGLEQVVVTSQSVGGVSGALLNPFNLIWVIYIGGVVFFMLRFFSSLARIHFLYFRFPRIHRNGFVTVLMDSNISPFSFFRILFISRSDDQSGAMDVMLTHEKAHADAYHSVDILLLELLTILQWFNPFAWLFGRALKSEHEYLADSSVLSAGFDRVSYQQLLVEKTLGIPAFSLTNSFNYSLLKNRIKMMTAKRRNRLAWVKYLVLVPAILTASILITVRCTNEASLDEVYTEVEVMPKYKGDDISGIRRFVADNLKYPQSAVDAQVEGRIFIQFTISKKGNLEDVIIVQSIGAEDTEGELVAKAIADLEAEALRVTNLLTDFTPGQIGGKDVSTSFTFPIIFRLN